MQNRTHNNKSLTRASLFAPAPKSLPASDGRRGGEQGWALLGLILMLAIIGIVLTSTVAPNVSFQIQREKEEEMLYRGDQMAEAIARYYGRGRIAGIQLAVPPPYGYLTDLAKLRDGVIMGVTEMKFVRASALIDPMTGTEWEPVYARDPRIMNVLQAYSAQNQVPIPPSYLLLAGAPTRTETLTPPTPQQPVAPPQQPGQPPRVVPAPPANDEELDDDDDEEGDDDDDDGDPLGHLFEPGKGTLPIVGVAPKLKGPSVRSLYGLRNYQEWVFIYIPPARLLRPGVRINPNQPPPNQGRPQISP